MKVYVVEEITGEFGDIFVFIASVFKNQESAKKFVEEQENKKYLDYEDIPSWNIKEFEVQE